MSHPKRGGKTRHLSNRSYLPRPIWRNPSGDRSRRATSSPHSFCKIERNDPKATQAVGDAITPGPAPLTLGGNVPMEDLVTSGEPLGDPGEAGGDLVIDQETTIAIMDRPNVDVPQPREAPSHTPGRGTGITAPQQTSQSQRLFADTQPQVIITDPLIGPEAPRQADAQNTAFTEMFRDIAFANLNLGGIHGN